MSGGPGLSRAMFRAAPRAVALGVAMVVTPAVALAAQTPDADPASTVGPAYTTADVRFMRDMIVHHAQAVEMTDLVDARTERQDIVMLARRIAVAQADEMEQMRRWLEVRGESVPDPGPDHGHGGHHHHGAATHDHPDMPGMLTPEEMARLAAARGSEFDRLFLESMIRHHQGALVMVEELMAADGAAQEPEIFQFASHVDSDQRIEIARMRAMLEAITPPEPR